MGLRFRSGLRFKLGLLGWRVLAVVLWWILAAVCAVGFFFGSWGLRLWLVVVAVAVAMIRGDELEKLKPWRF